MRIALYGYGKMGKAIEQAATTRSHEVGLRVTSANEGASPVGHDVAIEFSLPGTALANVELCLRAGVPVVVGTTGWYDRMNDLRTMVTRTGGSVLWASNFSIGVNLFFRVNRMLAGLMDRQPAYRAHIDEIHHIHKLDAPSGTAITLARDIDLRTQRYSGWELKEQEQGNAGLRSAPALSTLPVPIFSERKGEVPGKHAVSWTSGSDRIVITHEAFDRTGFAQGAVVAAEWLKGRKGLFTMDDVLDSQV
ncbi:MAG: 4-hydroxy-tetrahydrodipicolinate reductase [Flavobacteriales bacterium]|nr:4-hydroxy-tetrahydrodipicolinate reductase [Flavobacteriales bacterium]